jgi:hypothetical protein
MVSREPVAGYGVTSAVDFATANPEFIFWYRFRDTAADIETKGVCGCGCRVIPGDTKRAAFVYWR